MVEHRRCVLTRHRAWEDGRGNSRSGREPRISANGMSARPPNTRRTPRALRDATLHALRDAKPTALLLAALLSGHGLLWLWLGSRLQHGLEAWVAVRQAQGWQVTHDAPTRGGWPFAATLRLPRFTLAGGTATLPGGLDWQAEAVVLRVGLPRPDRLLVELPGQHRLQLDATEFQFAADRLVATLPLTRDAPPREAMLEAAGLRLGTAAGPMEVRAARLDFDTRSTATGDELALRLTAEGIGLPDGALTPGNPLGREMRSVALDLAVSGPWPPERGPTRSAIAWRDGGGTLDIRSADLRWGAVAATATATLALDAALQPMGTGTLRLAGGGETLSAAAAAGLLTRRVVASARLLLALLARVPPEGGPARLEVPLALAGRSLSVGQVPLLRLPAWTWPPVAAAVPSSDDRPLPPRQ